MIKRIMALILLMASVNLWAGKLSQVEYSTVNWQQRKYISGSYYFGGSTTGAKIDFGILISSTGVIESIIADGLKLKSEQIEILFSDVFNITEVNVGTVAEFSALGLDMTQPIKAFIVKASTLTGRIPDDPLYIKGNRVKIYTEEGFIAEFFDTLYMQGRPILDVGEPINPQSAATKNYVDNVAGGVGVLESTNTFIAPNIFLYTIFASSSIEALGIQPLYLRATGNKIQAECDPFYIRNKDGDDYPALLLDSKPRIRMIYDGSYYGEISYSTAPAKIVFSTHTEIQGRLSLFPTSGYGEITSPDRIRIFTGTKIDPSLEIFGSAFDQINLNARYNIFSPRLHEYGEDYPNILIREEYKEPMIDFRVNSSHSATILYSSNPAQIEISTHTQVTGKLKFFDVANPNSNAEIILDNWFFRIQTPGEGTIILDPGFYTNEMMRIDEDIKLNDELFIRPRWAAFSELYPRIDFTGKFTKKPQIRMVCGDISHYVNISYSSSPAQLEISTHTNINGELRIKDSFVLENRVDEEGYFRFRPQTGDEIGIVFNPGFQTRDIFVMDEEFAANAEFTFRPRYYTYGESFPRIHIREVNKEPVILLATGDFAHRAEISYSSVNMRLEISTDTKIEGDVISDNLIIGDETYSTFVLEVGTTSISTTATSYVQMDDMNTTITISVPFTIDIDFSAPVSNLLKEYRNTVRLTRNGTELLFNQTENILVNAPLNNVLTYSESLGAGTYNYKVEWKTNVGTITQDAPNIGQRILRLRIYRGG